jgi:hypothetical protein
VRNCANQKLVEFAIFAPSMAPWTWTIPRPMTMGIIPLKYQYNHLLIHPTHPVRTMFNLTTTKTSTWISACHLCLVSQIFPQSCVRVSEFILDERTIDLDDRLESQHSSVSSNIESDSDTSTKEPLDSLAVYYHPTMNGVFRLSNIINCFIYSFQPDPVTGMATF